MKYKSKKVKPVRAVRRWAYTNGRNALYDAASEMRMLVHRGRDGQLVRGTFVPDKPKKGKVRK